MTWKSLYFKGWCSCNYVHRTFPIHTVYKHIIDVFFVFWAVQGPFWHLFLSALSTIAWRNWDILQTCSRRVATGPYTNLAAALHRDSTVTRTKIRRVYAEGGRLHVPEGLYAPFFFWFWQPKTVILSPKKIEVRHSFRFFAHVVYFSFRSIQVYVPQCFGFVSCGFSEQILFRVLAPHRANNVMAQLLPMKREGY